MSKKEDENIFLKNQKNKLLDILYCLYIHNNLFSIYHIHTFQSENNVQWMPNSRAMSTQLEYYFSWYIEIEFWDLSNRHEYYVNE